MESIQYATFSVRKGTINISTYDFLSKNRRAKKINKKKIEGQTKSQWKIVTYSGRKPQKKGMANKFMKRCSGVSLATNPPCGAGDTGLTPAQGYPTCPEVDKPLCHSYWACEPQNPCSAKTEATAMRSLITATRESPHAVMKTQCSQK